MEGSRRESLWRRLLIGYFELRAWVPLVAFALYLLFGKRVGKWGVGLAIGVYLAAASVLVLGMASGVPLKDVVGAKLSYESAVEGMVFGALVVYMLWRVTRDAGLSIVSSVLCLSAVGWLYEVAFWHPLSMFIYPISEVSPLFVNTQIISLVLFIILMWRRGWRPGILFAFALMVFLIQSTYLALVGESYYLFAAPIRDWLVRPPSYALIYSMMLPRDLLPSLELEEYHYGVPS